MAISPTGILPEPLMRPGKLGEVLAAIVALPMTGDDKVELLVGWARAVGVQVSASQRDRVRASGIDHLGIPSTPRTPAELERELSGGG